MPKYAASGQLGLIGGEVIADHKNGDVTLLFAGALKLRGAILTAAEIRAFETKQ